MSNTRHNIILPDDLWEEVAQFVQESEVFDTASQFVRWAVRQGLRQKGETENETK